MYTNTNNTNNKKKNILLDFEIVDLTQTVNKSIQFNKKMEQYANNEYIPISFIHDILQFYMPTSAIIHSFNEEHIVIKCQVNDLLEAPIINWEYNRPPDMTRCPDIAKYMYHSKRPIDSLFYLHYNNLKKVFEVIDGIHRYTALKLIKQDNNAQPDFICPSDYNDAKWLLNQYILVNIRFNCPVGILIEVFQNLNKSHPVPELYIRDSSKEKRNIIETITNAWQINYKSHFSSHSKPNKPNINRDKFIELLDKIYDKYKITEENKFVLENLLDHANTHVRRNIPKKITKSSLDKCQETGCYLFLLPLDKLENII
jgi:hypothetical protein